MSHNMIDKFEEDLLIVKQARYLEAKGLHFLTSKYWIKLDEQSPRLSKLFNAKKHAYDNLELFIKEKSYAVKHNHINYGEKITPLNIKSLTYKDFEKFPTTGHFYTDELEKIEKAYKKMKKLDPTRYMQDAYPAKLKEVHKLKTEQHQSIENVSLAFDEYYSQRFEPDFDIFKLDYIIQYVKTNSTSNYFKELYLQRKDQVVKINETYDTYKKMAELLKDKQEVPSFGKFLRTAEHCKFSIKELEEDGNFIGQYTDIQLKEQSLEELKNNNLQESRILLEKANLQSAGKYQSTIYSFESYESEQDENEKENKLNELKMKIVVETKPKQRCM
ncbi:MAG: hypothetical protein IJZ26_02425 [Clostridia bacterium]|nr:hypothetical protein [Clostridia bacterium]